MSTLNPLASAQAASSIYEILDPTVQLHTVFPQYINDNFDLSAGKKLTGESGGMILHATSGFGIAARGKSTEYKNDALIVIRGTKKLADWVTDAKATWVRPNGTRIHSGFNSVFESLKPQLETFFVNYHPHCVHIVGHSLGGAIGTLISEWVKSTNKATSVKLYTFGCPRVGLSRYANVFTDLVKAENVYRVYNPTDVIPMVPTFPYVHVPLPGTESYASHHNTIWTPVSITAHFMDNYIKGVNGLSWEKLKKPQVREDFDGTIEYWLATKNITSLSVYTVKMIYIALEYVIKKIVYATGQVFDAAVYGVNTLIDMLAIYLERGARAVKEINGYVMGLIKNIISALGIIVSIPKDITAAFIRWIFEKLSATLYMLAKTALRKTFTA